MTDLIIILTWAALVAFGAVVRALLGIYKAYNTYPDFKPEVSRIVFEIFASIGFGTFALYLLQGVGVFTFALGYAAPIAGLFGADAIGLITKRFGLTKGLHVTVSKQQMQYADVNERQMRGLEYVKHFGKITNKIYQKLNQVNHDIAKYELATLVGKGKLMKLDSGKNISYSFQQTNQLGKIRVISGVLKRPTQKIHQKLPGQKIGTVNLRSGGQNRLLQNSQLTREKLRVKHHPDIAQ